MILTRHTGTIGLLGFVSFLVSYLVSPSDPITIILVTWPIFFVGLLGYFLGIRNSKPRV